MPDVREVSAIVSNPDGHDPLGRVTIGFFTQDGDLITMTDGEGTPVRPGLAAS